MTDKAIPILGWISFNLGKATAELLDMQHAIAKNTEAELTAEGFREIFTHYHVARQEIDTIEKLLQEVGQYFDIQV